MKLLKTCRVLFLASSIALVAACPARSAAPAPGPVVEPSPVQSDPDPLITADGHFAAARTYQGECMPAGSRGGCYSITLEPDGQFRHMLLDAAVTGTYVIKGDNVDLTPSGSTPPSTMVLSADRATLGDYAYQPAVEP